MAILSCHHQALYQAWPLLPWPLSQTPPCKCSRCRSPGVQRALTPNNHGNSSSHSTILSQPNPGIPIPSNILQPKSPRYCSHIPYQPSPTCQQFATNPSPSPSPCPPPPPPPLHNSSHSRHSPIHLSSYSSPPSIHTCPSPRINLTLILHHSPSPTPRSILYHPNAQQPGCNRKTGAWHSRYCFGMCMV